jgi:hypothetical protein
MQNLAIFPYSLFQIGFEMRKANLPITTKVDNDQAATTSKATASATLYRSWPTAPILQKYSETTP